MDSLPVVDKLLERMGEPQEKLVAKVERQQQQLLAGFYRREEKIIQKIRRSDSAKARLLETDLKDRYQKLQNKLKQPYQNTGASSPYIPRIDSLETMLKWLGPISNKKEELGKALQAVDGLKAQLARNQEIEEFIKEREQSLRTLLSADGVQAKLPIHGLSNSISRYRKEFYYYKEKTKTFKESLQDPEKMERQALAIARKIPAFQKFMQQNSLLAQLFGPGVSDGGTANPAGLAGLQTRAAVTQQIQQQFGQSVGDPRQYIQQQVGAAQTELNRMKNRLESMRSGGHGDVDIPKFKPNSQRSKPFLKRLEYGLNLQTGNKGAYDFPATNDLSLTLGYKLHDRLAAGVGMAYRFGLGKGWKNLDFTHEGIGLRTYVDFKLSDPQKGLRALFGNFWLSGGYEKNYMSRFKNEAALRHVAWQTSGLVGISKKLRMKKKELKVSMLWNFLNRQSPIGQPFIFRYGYNF
ncbi:hypothetical protein D3H65_12080 [Paraflavitalea soli]|uniref:Uncharacterized protein n=2 Tax=Paraflavitalea soli TaxID=2315862 RepID=A0A3B7MJP5_9BACT|nr:hypothetical protein D3H65_12080 [Paraflavitalea soli]